MEKVAHVAKTIDLVGNPVRKVGYIAFVAAYAEGIEGHFST